MTCLYSKVIENVNTSIVQQRVFMSVYYIHNFVCLKIADFWDISPCNLTEVDRCVRRA
jgi:hypothetical protein